MESKIGSDIDLYVRNLIHYYKDIGLAIVGLNDSQGVIRVSDFCFY